MNICLMEDNGMSAIVNCRAMPFPQSMRYEVPLTMITVAGAALFFFGVGPPPVPNNINLVPLPLLIVSYISSDKLLLVDTLYKP